MFPESNLLLKFVHILLDFLFHPLTLFHLATHSLKKYRTVKFTDILKQTIILYYVY